MDPSSASGIHRLSNGASGAGVFGLDLDGRPVVLKISANPRFPEPGRELRMYRELAGRLPIRTPAVLSSATTAGKDYLLLARATPAPPARDWTRDKWIEVGSQLARLHGTFEPTELHGRAWLKPDPRRLDPDQRRQVWQQTPCADIAARLLDDVGQLDIAAASLPTCLIHGDCHAENLLLDEHDALIWADWQQVTYRKGPEDLALLWQRAEFNAAEILLLLNGWPPFLLQRRSPGRAALLRRLRTLQTTWQQSN